MTTTADQLDALNLDTEHWLRDPLRVTEHMRAQLAIARQDSYHYADLSLAYEGHTLSPHPMHTLLHEARACAKAAGKHIAYVFPPGSGKSQRIIKECVHDVGRGVAGSTSYISYAEDVCKRNIIWTRKTLVSPLTQELWPNIRPDAGRSLAGGGWSTEHLYLQGESDPAFDAHTVLSDRGGLRRNHLFFDDIITIACKDSETTRRKVDEAFHGMWLPRLTADGFAEIAGNCWHRDDTLHRLKNEEFADKWCVLWLGYEGYERMYWHFHNPPATWEYGEEGHLPLWAPYPASKLRTIDRSTYKRLYEQRATLVEEMRFIPVERWARWEESNVRQQLEHGALIYGGMDISGGLDLRKNDYAALGAVMIDNAHREYVLDFWCARAKVTDQIRALWMMHERLEKRWGQGFARAVVEALRWNTEWFRLPMEAVQEQLRKDGNQLWTMAWGFWTPPHNKSKNVLIDSMAMPFESGNLMFPPDILELRKLDPSWTQLVNQTEDFPPPPSSKTDHDDAPNALAIALDEARRLGPGLSRAVREHNARVQDAKREIVSNHPLTGKPLIQAVVRKFGI